MGFELKYMGTKRRLAHVVAQAVARAKPGIFFDAFAGMCAVGDAIGFSRQVWNNDVQIFAAKAAAAMFTFEDGPPHFLDLAELHHELFRKNKKTLAEEFGPRLVEEAKVLASSSLSLVSDYLSRAMDEYASDRTETRRLQYEKNPTRRPYILFTLLYAESYFGLRQCIEIDSIICSIDHLAFSGLITAEQKDWLLLALGQAMLRGSSTVGHFAQYLTPKEKTLSRFLAQRRRSIRDEWLLSLSCLSPRGTKNWRRKNRAFRADCTDIVKVLSLCKKPPSVIYADPPYTDDQYSRYYHLLETLFLYDYPKTSSKGRYRTGRFQTAFSQRSRAIDAVDQFAAAVAATGADLLLSYPDNGLLHQLGSTPKTILKESFKKVRQIAGVETTHSTFGASKGRVTIPVREILYHATP